MEKSREKYRWLLVFLGFLCMAFYYGIIINCQGQLIQPIIGEQYFSRATISSVFALINGGMIISSPIMGRLSDRIGPELTMVGSSVTVACGMLIFASAKSLPVYYIGALLVGMAFVGVTLMMIPVLIDKWFDKTNRGFALSLAFMGSGIGGLLLNPLFALMAENFGWRLSYVLWAGFYLLIISPILFLFVYFIPSRNFYNEFFKAKETRCFDIEKKPVNNYFRIISLLCIASFLIGGVGTSVLMHGASHLIQLGKTPKMAAIIIGLFLGVLAFCKILVGKSCDKIGCKKTLMIFLTIASLGVFSLNICGGKFLGCLGFVIFFGIGAPTMTVCPPLLVREIFPPERYSRELGKVMSSIGLGNMGLPLIAGFIFDLTGSYSYYWTGGSFALILAIGLYVMAFNISVKGRQEKKERENQG